MEISNFFLNKGIPPSVWQHDFSFAEIIEQMELERRSKTISDANDFMLAIAPMQALSKEGSKNIKKIFKEFEREQSKYDLSKGNEKKTNIKEQEEAFRNKLLALKQQKGG
ncbi:hypothetical protein MHB40_20470 [Lysinibacillus sp. FSL K6-0057]|uniref:hypothetical protein n=1 Tax=Lysinibacillus sp. FSL K6-0057 TaxID=2921411 RepID=UPI00315B2B8E